MYGGCDGNANRYSTANECESLCINREELPYGANQTDSGKYLYFLIFYNHESRIFFLGFVKKFYLNMIEYSSILNLS